MTCLGRLDAVFQRQCSGSIPGQHTWNAVGENDTGRGSSSSSFVFPCQSITRPVQWWQWTTASTLQQRPAGSQSLKQWTGIHRRFSGHRQWKILSNVRTAEEEEAATEAEKVRRKIIGSMKAGSGSSRQREVTKCLTKFLVKIPFLLCLQVVNC